MNNKCLLLLLILQIWPVYSMEKVKSSEYIVSKGLLDNNLTEVNGKACRDNKADSKNNIINISNRDEILYCYNNIQVDTDDCFEEHFTDRKYDTDDNDGFYSGDDEEEENQILIDNNQSNKNNEELKYTNTKSHTMSNFTNKQSLFAKIEQMISTVTSSKKSESLDDFIYGNLLKIERNELQARYNGAIVNYLNNAKDTSFKKLHKCLKCKSVQKVLNELRNQYHINSNLLYQQLEPLRNNDNNELIDQIIILTSFGNTSWAQIYNAMQNSLQKQEAINVFLELFSSPVFETFLINNSDLKSLCFFAKIVNMLALQPFFTGRITNTQISNICTILEKYIPDNKSKENDELRTVVLSILSKLNNCIDLTIEHKSFQEFYDAIFNKNNPNQQLEAINNFILLLQNEKLKDYFTASGCAKLTNDELKNYYKSNSLCKTTSRNKISIYFKKYIENEVIKFTSILLAARKSSDDERIKLLKQSINNHKHSILHNVKKILDELKVPNSKTTQQNIFAQKRDAIMLALAATRYNNSSENK